MRIFKITGWFIGILVIGYVLFVATMLFSPMVQDYVNRTGFDSGKWKNWEESENELTLRWDMVSDLTSNYELVGLTIQEVENLLGTPDQSTKNSYAYYLGSLGIDTGTLFLTIENGVVTEYDVHRG